MSYLAQVSLYWLLLYGCYWLVLRRHTFFAWNRAYLLGALLGAFALPLVPYPEVAPPVPRIVYEMAALPIETIPVVVETQHAVSLPNAPAAAPFPWVEGLWVIYALGVVVMAIRLFRHLRQVRAFIRQGTCLDMDAYRLCVLENDPVGVGSFSFLNHIVLNHTDYEHNFDTILHHELAHVRQRHSWDILLVEVLRVVFWFNPVLILYKKSLQQVHEYLADREVCEWETTLRDRYAEFMVSYTMGTPVAVLANPFFNSSLLKDRITMLYKNRNSNWSLGKYAAVALLIGSVSLLAASCEQKANEKSGTEETTAVADKAIVIEGTITGTDGTPLPGASIIVKGSQRGTTTTPQGEFILHAPADSELDFSLEGHKSTSIKMSEQGTVKVALAQESASEASTAIRISSDIGMLGISPKAPSQPTPDASKDSVYTVVAKNPEFPGGIKAMYNFIQNVMKYPAPARRSNVEGKVFLTFVVNSDGSIQNIQVLKGLGFACDEEAIRVVSAMPKWIPGEKANGEKVNVKYNLPISFVLPKKEKELSADLPVQILQQVRIKGVVVDANNKPLTHAVVKTSNGRTSFLTDQLGEYGFLVPTGSELVFYSTRHKIVKVKVAKNHIINAVLAQSNAVDPSVVNVYEYVHEEHRDATALGEGKFIPKIMPKDDSSGIKNWKWYLLGKND